MAEIIDGKKVSAHIREQIKDNVTRFKQDRGVTPGLAVILVGDNPASMVYVRNKHKARLECGINSFEITLPADVSEKDLLAEIARLNADSSVHGILVQLPLPKHISEDNVINAIDPDKDVDAFHPVNVGKIMTGKYEFLPCTPAGVMSLLDYYGVELEGKNCVVIGRSNIVGKPMAHLLLERNATVTVCHSRTVNLSDITRNADLIVVAIGRAGFLKADMVKDGAVIVDVGINRLDSGKLAGDVAFDEVSDVASLITPVPGGVGPMTITTLLRNTLKAAERLAR
jgi:methylenetetrahydrofolate dehydrogenase (NADP+)/methenyltetrahydrofolate cyclohydrolase